MSRNSKSPVSGFQSARTTSELGDAPSGMKPSSSPLLSNSGDGSYERRAGPRRRGRCAASGQETAEARVRSTSSPGCCRVLDAAGPVRRRVFTRQKPALWSATQTRSSGSTIAPVETCSPSARSDGPAAAARCAKASETESANVRLSARARSRSRAARSRGRSRACVCTPLTTATIPPSLCQLDDIMVGVPSARESADRRSSGRGGPHRFAVNAPAGSGLHAPPHRHERTRAMSYVAPNGSPWTTNGGLGSPDRRSTGRPMRGVFMRSSWGPR